jgi:hypothetical protein
MLGELPCNVALVRLQGGLDNPCDVRYLEQVPAETCVEIRVKFHHQKKTAMHAAKCQVTANKTTL